MEHKAVSPQRHRPQKRPHAEDENDLVQAAAVRHHEDSNYAAHLDCAHRYPNAARISDSQILRKHAAYQSTCSVRDAIQGMTILVWIDVELKDKKHTSRLYHTVNNLETHDITASRSEQAFKKT